MQLLNKKDNATLYLQALLILGGAVLFLRLLLWTDTFHTSLLYIAWPFGLSLVIYYFTPHTDGSSWRKRFWNNVRISMIFLLASSLILMEGYICVVMFLPIFFAGVLIAFIAFYLRNRFGKGSINAHIVPLVVALVSLEGVTDATTFNRYNEVTHTQVVQSSLADIRQRLEKPAKPKAARHWMLSIFPMPKTIGTVSLDEGEIRTYEFEYHRWFAANTHKGKLEVTFLKVENNRFKTRIDDTSYISGYMKLHGTELTLDPISETETRVTLKIAFDRVLDPIWYFEPMQRFAVEKGADYFVKNLLGQNA